MTIPHLAGSDATYVAARRFVDAALRSSDSIFTPGRRIWDREPVDELTRRFVEDPNAGPDFLVRLEEQLEGARAATLQLAAEVLFVHDLVESDTSGGSKRRRIETILSWLPEGVAISAELSGALDSGIARIGTGKALLPQQLRFLIRFAAAWLHLGQGERDEALEDPWLFKQQVEAIPKDGGGLQGEALLHLAFPETFEPIVSTEVKRKIASAFQAAAGPRDDVDRQLGSIRARLGTRLGPAFSFYEDPLPRRIWDGKGEHWDEYVTWVERLFALDGFDEEERDYKLRISGRLQSAAEAFRRGSEEWRVLLRQAFSGENNLTNWREQGKLLDWIDRAGASELGGVAAVWDEGLAPVEGVRLFLDQLPREVASGPAARVGLASYLTLARGAEEHPFIRPSLFDETAKLLGRSRGGGDEFERYRDAVGLLDELVLRAWGSGCKLRDRLDAQSVLWWIVKGEPPEEWDEAEREAFLHFRSGAEPAPRAGREPGRGVGPAPSPGREPGRRAWLVRGANVDGVNLVPEWLEHGYVSIGWYDVGELDAEVEPARVRELVKETYPDEPPGSWATGAGNLIRFVRLMHPGHLVVTVDGDRVYVGRVESDPAFVASSLFPEAARRRSVEWLNAEAPASRDGIRDTSPSLYSRLRTLLTVTDLKDDAAAVAALAGLAPPPPPEPQPILPEVTADVAESVFVPRDWLQHDLVDLLQEKGQVILFGPPGTGKTLIAQRLADHLVREGGEVELIQFHPSYSYEDFFEGYRPIQVDGGVGISYELTPGPLRRIAEVAAGDPEHPYVLIIDEINRGNVPKIFGELLFLLEYRTEQIPLQYSPESQFGLPRNLFLIGTMNTADRSIALVDAALRRRFYFVPFMPREEPIGSVLRRWLEAHGHHLEPARLLDALNERIANDEIAIGPSYFMTGDGSAPNLERIWKHAIIPVLEEHFHGTGRDVPDEFSLETLRKEIAVSDRAIELSPQELPPRPEGPGSAS